MANSTPLRSCEQHLVDWIREHAVPYGTVSADIQVEYQDSVPVMLRISLFEVQEKLR